MKATRDSSRGAITGGPGRQPQNTWIGGSRGRDLPTQTHPQTTPQPRARNAQLNQGAGHALSVGNVGKWDITDVNAPL